MPDGQMISARGRRLPRMPLLVSALCVFSACTRGPSPKEVRLQLEVDSLRVALRQSAAASRDRSRADHPFALDDVDLQYLKIRGLANPPADLFEDLRKHPELLPQDKRCEDAGAFYFVPEVTCLLTTRWLLATFEDGMCEGRLLLEFTVGDSGRISWKPVAWSEK